MSASWLARFRSSYCSFFISSLGQLSSIKSYFSLSQEMAFVVLIPMVLGWLSHHENVASSKVHLENLTFQFSEKKLISNTDFVFSIYDSVLLLVNFRGRVWAFNSWIPYKYMPFSDLLYHLEYYLLQFLFLDQVWYSYWFQS